MKTHRCYLLTIAIVSGCLQAENIQLTAVPTPFPGYVLGDGHWADFDRDGRPDLVIAGSTRGNPDRLGIYLYLNRASAFVETTAGLMSRGASRMSIIDYDGDGDLDIANSDLQFGTVFLNDGNANFSADPRIQLLSGHVAIEFGDLDSDGDLDLVFGPGIRYRNDNGVMVLQAQSFYPFVRGTTKVIDIDGDGIVEVIQSGSTQNGLLAVGQIWKRTTNNNFAPFGDTLPSVNFEPRIFARDGNCDGRPDLLFATDAGDNVARAYYFRNLGAGSFQRFALLGSGGPLINGGGLIDFNGDGIDEIVVSGNLEPGVPTSRYGTVVYRLMDGQYQVDANVVLPAMSFAQFRGVDYDLDGDEDLFMVGAYYPNGTSDVQSEASFLFRNDTAQRPRCVLTQPVALAAVPAMGLGSRLLLAFLCLVIGVCIVRDRR